MLTCHQLGLGPKETPWLLARSRATRMRAAGHAEAARPAEKPLPPPADTAACYMLEALNAAPSPTSPKESLAVVHVHGPSPGRGMAMATYAASTPCILLQSKEYEKEHCRQRRGDAVGGQTCRAPAGTTIFVASGVHAGARPPRDTCQWPLAPAKT
jgi:hypothetical protein